MLTPVTFWNVPVNIHFLDNSFWRNKTIFIPFCIPGTQHSTSRYSASAKYQDLDKYLLLSWFFLHRRPPIASYLIQDRVQTQKDSNFTIWPLVILPLSFYSPFFLNKPPHNRLSAIPQPCHSGLSFPGNIIPHPLIASLHRSVFLFPAHILLPLRNLPHYTLSG